MGPRIGSSNVFLLDACAAKGVGPWAPDFPLWDTSASGNIATLRQWGRAGGASRSNWWSQSMYEGRRGLLDAASPNP